MTRKEEVLLNVITVKGFEKAKENTTMSFGEALAKLALTIAKENIEEDEEDEE